MSVYDAKVVSEHLLSNDDSRWLKLSEVTFVDPTGKNLTYEKASRATRPVGSKIDAAVILAILTNSPSSAVPPRSDKHEKGKLIVGDDGDENVFPRVVLVAQFRPPIGKVSIEFPAGLVDPVETAEQTAVRELREETGYVGKQMHNSKWADIPISASGPGTFAGTESLVALQVDLSDPANAAGRKQSLDADEFVEIITVPLIGMKAAIAKLVTGEKGEKSLLDSRVIAFAEGLEMAHRLGDITRI